MPSRTSLREPPGIGYHPKLEPDDIRNAPELAVIEAADAVLDTTVAAIVAANPELLGSDPFEPAFDGLAAAPTRIYAADAVVYLTYALRSALDRYRCAIRSR